MLASMEQFLPMERRVIPPQMPAGLALLRGMISSPDLKVSLVSVRKNSHYFLINILAVHTPQPIRVERNFFSPVKSDLFVTGRENWTSFGSTPSAPVAINSVPVQIENQSTSKDLISL